MSEKFPSKWLEVDRKKGGGDAAVWILQGMDRKGSRLRKRSIKQPRNSKRTDGKAMDKEKEILMMGKANVFEMKQDDPKYKHHRVAKELKSGLDQNGLMDLGNTYLVDNKLQNGKIEEFLVFMSKIFLSTVLKCGL